MTDRNNQNETGEANTRTRIPGSRLFKHPTTFWTGLAAVTVLAAMVMPSSWTASVRGDQNKLSPFSPEVAELSESLRQNNRLPPTFERDRLATYLPYLKTRRIMRAGPMKSSEVDTAVSIFKEYERSLRRQSGQKSRKALRQQRNKRLARAVGRLDSEVISRKLQKLRKSIRRATRQTPD